MIRALLTAGLAVGLLVAAPASAGTTASQYDRDLAGTLTGPNGGTWHVTCSSSSPTTDTIGTANLGCSISNPRGQNIGGPLAGHIYWTGAKLSGTLDGHAVSVTATNPGTIDTISDPSTSTYSSSGTTCHVKQYVIAQRPATTTVHVSGWGSATGTANLSRDGQTVWPAPPCEPFADPE